MASSFLIYLDKKMYISYRMSAAVLISKIFIVLDYLILSIIRLIKSEIDLRR